MAIWHVWHTSQAISTMQKRANANNSSMAAAVATKIDSKVNKHVKIIASTKLPIKNRNNFLFVNVHCAVLLIWFNRSAPQQKQTVNLKEMHNWNEIKLIRCVRLFVFCFVFELINEFLKTPWLTAVQLTRFMTYITVCRQERWN